MSNDTPSLSPVPPEIRAFIERNWFELDQGWVDFGANQFGDEAKRKVRKDAEDAAGHLMREMATQHNTAVVAAANYVAAFAEQMAQAANWSAPRPAIDI